MMRYCGWRLAALMALVLLLGACASTQTDERLSIAPELTGSLEVGQVVTAETAGGLLQVDVRVRSLIDRPLLLITQFEWLDDQGRAVPSLLSGKRPVAADRRRWLSIRGTAPSPEITDFRLYLDERGI